MTLVKIMDVLERSPATGAQAERAARMGFLQWACLADGPVTAEHARRALRCQVAKDAKSAAACAFVEILHQASRNSAPLPARRARARTLH
ncbi:hypothetical protein [uncultured Roseovarius sp.]|uniref:hypothetical protein n=1 Tax=uncultured Roseovarius sp. TaxID=293344 RepID=UPI0026354CB9|nr:hypothetical protein [uncultured Roseovarius sp.]